MVQAECVNSECSRRGELFDCPDHFVEELHNGGILCGGLEGCLQPLVEAGARVLNDRET